MKSRSKKIFVIALALMLVLQTFFDLDIFKRKIEVQGAQPLQAGDWLYLDTSASGGQYWENDKAKSYVFMKGNDGSDFSVNLPMTKVGEHLFRVKIPTGTQEIKFRRIDPGQIWNIDNWVPSTWNQIPDNDSNISIANVSTNVYCVTGSNAGNWGSGWRTVSKAGKTIYFRNMDLTTDMNGIQAVFYNDEIRVPLAENSVTMTSMGENYYSVTVPADSDNEAYEKVKFVKDGKTYADVSLVDGTYSDSTNTYYYARSVRADGTVVGGFDKNNTSTGSVSNETIYFDGIGLGIDDSNPATIQIGNASEDKISITEDSYHNKVYKYTIPHGTELNQQTIITVKSRGNVFRFYWEDLSKDKVVVEANGYAAVDEKYDAATEKLRTIFYDANFSELPYTYDNQSVWTNWEIPQKSTGTINYYATNGSENKTGPMTSMAYVLSENGNSYSSVYKVELPERFDNIVFSNFIMTSSTSYGGHGESTGTLTIPTDVTNPCFYADTSDDVVYTGGQRSGYWAQLGTVRNPEDAAKSKYGEDAQIVDIPTGTFARQDEKLYINTSFYDFYSDYELNGSNRDKYGETGSTHRKYQQFRQFNLALSDYYSNTKAVSPLYWGNFQNYNGSHFTEIGSTLNLYGSENSRKLFYENNSMWGINGEELKYNDGKEAGIFATQNLISNTLENGQLMYRTTDGGTTVAPYFNKDFLEGNNSKNAVLGKVYENVVFPFKKAAMKSQSDQSTNGTVDYWYFNGTPLEDGDYHPKSENLRMTYDTSKNQYYLNETNEEVHGVDSTYREGNHGNDMGKNFFPFNGGAQSQNSSTLNYGFAMKMQFDFTLTETGTVKNSEDKDVPIEFNFAGDDDVWIFIDGKLALDIGGDHGRVSGTLNFKKNNEGKYTYTISGIKNPSGGGVIKNQTGEFTIEGANTDQHTLTMYYMERGLWESNLFVSFNFPDHNYLDISKKVDTEAVDNELFSDYITNINNVDFDFEIKNYATHFPAKEVSETPINTGFVMKQSEISDYGSISAKGLVIPNKALYTKYTAENPSGISKTINTSENQGRIQLRNGEKAAFMDQFRRGSYLSLKEIIPSQYSEVFDTYWTMSENGAPVTSMGTGSSVTNGSITNLTNIQNLEVDDGRTEEYLTGNEEGAQIENDGYTVAVKPDKSFVFRSYSNPETKAIETRLAIAYTNKVKTGSLTVKKAIVSGSESLAGKKYKFKVKLSNTLFDSDKNLEFELEPGQEKTITGIPYGTGYEISEDTPTDNSKLESVTLSKQDAEPASVSDISNISGTIGEGQDKLTYQFNNAIKPPKTTVAITKIDADDSEHKLKDVEFKLEKLKNDGTVDTSFTALTYTTNDDGKIETAELDSGTYQLTETKTQAGYQLLAKSIKIEIDRSAGGKTKVDGKEVDVTDDKIAITVANIKKFTLPSTGGRGRTIIVLTGIILMWISGLLYTLSQTKNRNIKKERRI